MCGQIVQRSAGCCCCCDDSRYTAKVYRRAQGSLQQVGDCADETFTFRFLLDDCTLDREFASVWRR